MSLIKWGSKCIVGAIAFATVLNVNSITQASEFEYNRLDFQLPSLNLSLDLGQRSLNLQPLTLRLPQTFPNSFDDISGALSSGSGEEPSTVPEWDLVITAGGGYDNVEFDINSTGFQYKGKVTSLWLTANMTKDRYLLNTQLLHRSTDGDGSFSVADNDYYGLLIQPGYRLMVQGTEPINLDILGMLEIGYLDYESTESQWRMSPGIGVEASAWTGLGKFYTGYSFLHSRNIDGDPEITGDHYINIHNTKAGWVIPFSEHCAAGLSIHYTWAEDIPNGTADDKLTLKGEVSGMIAENVYLSGSYSHDIDGTDNRGFTVNVSFLW